MYNNQKFLHLRVPNPFDGSARTRLIRMGLISTDGYIN
jgi:hypothetical protein